MVRHLKLHSATSRITAGLTVTAWLHTSQQASHPPSGSTPNLTPGSTPSPQASSVPRDIVLALLGCLAQPAVVVTAEGAIQPYAELSAVYSSMQKQAQVEKSWYLQAVAVSRSMEPKATTVLAAGSTTCISLLPCSPACPEFDCHALAPNPQDTQQKLTRECNCLKESLRGVMMSKVYRACVQQCVCDACCRH